MNKLFISSLTAVALAVGVTAAVAHQSGYGPQGPGSWAGHMGQGWMGQGWMGQQGWGRGMMGPGMMGPGMMDPDMMMVMMDTNEDGVLSLDEFQAMPARMFKYLDANHDGKVTEDELKAFHDDNDDDGGQ